MQLPAPGPLHQQYTDFKEPDQRILISIMTREQPVTMRVKDYKIDAIQIFQAVGLPKSLRDTYFDTMRRHCAVDRVEPRRELIHAWIPFRDGVFLSQYLGIFKEMEPLFAQAAKTYPPAEENYFLQAGCPRPVFASRPKSKKLTLPNGFKGLQWRDYFIVYIPAKRKLNITYLLKIAYVTCFSLFVYFSSYPQVAREIISMGRRC